MENKNLDRMQSAKGSRGNWNTVTNSSKIKQREFRKQENKM